MQWVSKAPLKLVFVASQSQRSILLFSKVLPSRVDENVAVQCRRECCRSKSTRMLAVQSRRELLKQSDYGKGAAEKRLKLRGEVRRRAAAERSQPFFVLNCWIAWRRRRKIRGFARKVAWFSLQLFRLIRFEFIRFYWFFEFS